MKNRLTTFLLYGAAILWIAGWWGFAFQPSPGEPLTELLTKKTPKEPSSFLLLSPLKRETLRHALSGDFQLMARLINDWEVDAQILESQGINKIHHLSKPLYTRTQMLGRQLKEKLPLKELKVFPQSFVAATILMGLTVPESLCAVPKGFKEQNPFFTPAILKTLPQEVDKTEIERIFSMQPDLSFISYYSHPPLIQALKKQGIRLVSLDHVQTLDGVVQTIQQIGNQAQLGKEAELLSLFFEAAFLAVDNRVAALRHSLATNEKKILFMEYHNGFNLPSSNTFTHELLARLNINNFEISNQFNSLDHESIQHCKPDGLIIAAEFSEEAKLRLLRTNAFAELRSKIAFVNYDVQNSPTQFAVLAYFDLYQALATISE